MRNVMWVKESNRNPILRLKRFRRWRLYRLRFPRKSSLGLWDFKGGSGKSAPPGSGDAPRARDVVVFQIHRARSYTKCPRRRSRVSQNVKGEMRGIDRRRRRRRRSFLEGARAPREVHCPLPRSYKKAIHHAAPHSAITHVETIWEKKENTKKEGRVLGIGWREGPSGKSVSLFVQARGGPRKRKFVPWK